MAMSIEPLRAVRDHLSEVVDRVELQHERVPITRNVQAAGVLISPEDLAQLEETLSVLSDEGALADIREADQAYARGDVPARCGCGSSPAVSELSGYEIVLTPPARRALTDRLPEAVASAVIELVTTALVQQPRRVGKPLRGDLAGVWAARRGTYLCCTAQESSSAKSSSCEPNIVGMSTGRSSRSAGWVATHFARLSDAQPAALAARRQTA